MTRILRRARSVALLGLCAGLSAGAVATPGFLSEEPAAEPTAQEPTQPAEPSQEEPTADTQAPPRPQFELSIDEVTPLPLPDGTPEAIRVLVDELAKEGATVDFAKREVAVKGAILLDKMNPNYPIEYLIVTNGGFTHEAFGIVRVTASKLNAAFLAFGLQPGKTVQYVKRDPPPPMEKLISGEESEFDIVAPEGPIVDISVRWKDDTGDHIHPIEDMVRYLTNGKPLPRRGFCFIGSRFSKMIIDGERVERFMADVEGNLVSLYLIGFGNCLFDMNSDEGVESYLYDINSTISPPRGTQVSFVFSVR